MKLGKLVLAAAALGVGVLVVMSIPDIARYLKIRNM
jgi:hypothetical protein